MSKPYNQREQYADCNKQVGSSPDTGKGGTHDNPVSTGHPTNIGSAPGDLGNPSVAGKKVGSSPN